MKIRVCIVDDHIMVIEGLKTMLDGQGSMEVVSTFTSAEEYQEAEIECDVLLLDINLPGKNGIELCTELTKSKRDVSVIGITNFGDTAFVKNMMRSGAKGYLLKNTAREELIEAIHQVQLGNVYLSEKIKNQLLNDSIGAHNPNTFMPKLTRREKEVLKLIADEMTSSEIADKLFISLKTVESHRKNLHQKLEVRNTAGLIKVAIQKGLINV